MFKLFGSPASNKKIELDLRLTRDSVAAGDDFDAPHEKLLHVKIEPTWTAIFNAILEQKYLPTIGSGNATWVGVSLEPVAVLAQQWQWRARPIGHEPGVPSDLRDEQGRLRVHFSYLAQLDPEVAFEVLSRCSFSAMKMGLR